MRGLLAALMLTAGCIAGLAPPAAAHKSSDSYLTLRVEQGHVAGQWDIALRDLDYAIGIDSDNDGAITWGELRAHHRAIAAYALANLRIEADGSDCPTRATGHLVDDHSDGAYEVLQFVADCPTVPAALDIGYTLLFDLDPQHRGLLRLEAGGRTHSAVFSPDHQTWRLEGRSVALGRQFLDFFETGVWHIWTGFDHILFLCALLLPAVLEHRGGRWQAVESFRPRTSRDLGHRYGVHCRAFDHAEPRGAGIYRPAVAVDRVDDRRLGRSRRAE